MNTDAYSRSPTHRTAQFVVRDDCRENVDNVLYRGLQNDVVTQVNLQDRYPNESLIERRMSRSDRRFLMPVQPARLNVVFPHRYHDADLDHDQGSTMEYQVFRKEERNRSGASPETLAAISEYLNSPDSSSSADIKVKSFHTHKSSDSNKENIDPDIQFGIPVRDPDRNLYNQVRDFPSSDRAECSVSSHIIDEDFQPTPPGLLDMNGAISEIMYRDPPSFRQMLSTSTVKDIQDSKPCQTTQHASAGGSNMHGYNPVGSQNSSAQFATQPHVYAHCDSERRRRLIADMGYQPASSHSTVSGLGHKFDAFLAGEYVKRPVLRSRKFSLKLNVDTNKGYLGGNALDGEICVKLKRVKENEAVHISKVEITAVCVEDIGSSKRVIDSRKLFMRSDVDICNAGLHVISFSTTLPKNFGPGYFAGPRAKIKYLLFLCASARQSDNFRLLRTSEEIKFYNATNVEHSTLLRVSRVVTKTDNVRFVGCGSVSIQVESAQDYFEAGKYCYLRTSVFNHSSSVVSKLKMNVVRCIEYLDAARRTRKTQERVLTSSVFKASRDGWPKVEPMSEGAYTSGVRIPEFAVSIISSGFRVDYHVDVSVGGSLRQYVIARFPLTVFFKPDRVGPLIRGIEFRRRHGPGVPGISEPPNMLQEISPNRPFQGYRDTLSRNVGKLDYDKSMADDEDVPMQKNNFKSTWSVNESLEKLQAQNVVLRRDVRSNNGVDGFYSLRSMQDRAQLADAANDRLRQLLQSLLDNPRPNQERVTDDADNRNDWDYVECNGPGPTAHDPAVAVIPAKDAVRVRAPVDTSKCFV
ncbi:hypothetical protein V1525DRAFT_402339 [Lipomyces kononenkoae]|uniref:Uncharacterized protein n=1 Tax=Lipomyces kononenkoae TaxID=34357 RepID=A0ACC3T300_LIPKO